MDLDFEKLKEEEAVAKKRKDNLSFLGAIGDNLANRQSAGNFYLGQMNPKQDVSGFTDKLAANIDDPWQKRKQIYDQYKMAKEAKQAQADEQKLAESRDMNSERTKTDRALLAKLSPKLAAQAKNMTSEQIQEYFKNPLVKEAFQRETELAKIAAKAKGTPKGYEYVTDPVTGEEKLAKIESVKPNQYQAALYGQRLQQAEDAFGKLAEKGFDPTSKTAAVQRLGLYPEAFKSEDAKLQDQAERNFVNAILRRESGAAIAKSEFESAEQQYFPRVGDTPEVLTQKAQNRQLARAALKSESGKAWDEVGSTYAGLPAVNLPKAGKEGGLVPDAHAGQGASFDSRDIQALEWAKKNPKDPRAEAIVRRLKGKGL